MKSEEMKKKQKNLFGNGNNMAFEMNLEKGTVEFKVLEGENMLKQIAQHIGQAKKEHGVSEEGAEVEGSEEETSDNDQEEMVSRMSKLVSKLQEANGGEGGPEVDAASVHEMTKALHENIQDAFRSHF